MTDFDPVELLRALTRREVRFVLIGGVAARLHGAPLVTEDIDVTPASDHRNLTALAEALTDLEARLRVPDSAEGVAFPIDAAMLSVNQSWTLTTRAGDLDLVFLPAGTTGYADLARRAVRLPVTADGSLVIAVAALEDVIRTKQAAGRAKDLAALPLLRQTLAEILKSRSEDAD